MNPAWVAMGLFRTMRPRQWTKNAFVFLPLIFDDKMFQRVPLINTMLGFFILCALSSVVYLVNDSMDVEQDRLHPRKKNRPIARGDVSVPVALGWAIVLTVGGLVAAYILSFWFGIIASIYLGLQAAYNLLLKRLVLLDVFALASGFVLRVAAAIPLVRAERFSPWLFVCTFLLALLLGFGKRRGELVDLGDRAGTRAILQQYNLPLLDSLINVVTAALVVAYSSYTYTAPNLPSNHTMMLTIPVTLYGLFRYFYLVHVQGKGEAPDELVLKDIGLQLAAFTFVSIVVLVLYVFKAPAN